MTSTPTRMHPAVDAALSAASSLLGMEVVFLGGLTEETFTFEKVHAIGEWPGVEEGRRAPRCDTFCHRMLAGAPSKTSDARRDTAYLDASIREELGICSYVGVPVRGPGGDVVATLCGIDRRNVEVSEQAVEVLTHLADVISANLGSLAEEGVIIRRQPGGGWLVAEPSGQVPRSTGDLTSAMALADLLAADTAPGSRPPRHEGTLDEVDRLRLSVKQLEHALAARVVVEQAIGVLSERQHASPRESFERLRKVARSRGRKVHDLAREVVLSSTDPAVPLPPELAGNR